MMGMNELRDFFTGVVCGAAAIVVVWAGWSRR
jgi:hypothetical protein